MSRAPDFAEWMAICNLKAAYCRLLDTKDWTNWKQLFTEDCLIDTRDSGGSLEQGRDHYVAMIAETLANAKTAHHIHSPEMQIDGDTARVVWAMQDRVVKDEFSLTGYGHYHDAYVRTAEGWKIAELKLTRLIMEVDWKQS